MKHLQLKLISSVLAAGLAGSATVQADSQTDPYAKADDSWISINGTIESVSPDSFVLNYGAGTIIVEMDDGDRDAGGYKLMRDDTVTVNGVIDDDFFDTTTIDASSVYVEKLNTYFYASAVDDDDYNHTIWSSSPVAVGEVTVHGTVTDVGDEEFTLNNESRSLTVEVEEMIANPLAEDGYQRIEEGDIVRVRGEMDDDLFEGKELVADSIVVLDH